MAQVWFTSDLHLGHRLVSTKRGFETTAEHDAHVISTMLDINRRDLLWVLGDIAWRPEHLRLLSAIRGDKKAVLGNHDKMNTQVYLQHFKSVWGSVKKYDCWLTHIPIHQQEIYRGNANIHGHIHKNAGTPPLPFPYINVNWDFWHRPVPLSEILEIIKSNT